MALGRKVENALAKNRAQKKALRKPPEVVIAQALGEEARPGAGIKVSGDVKRVKVRPGESVIEAIDRATR